jgi:SAM-dependent methyltransferase
MSWRKLTVIPQLIWYGLRAPRDQAKAWERYWGGIRRTGLDGEVLWDAASQVELDAVQARMRAHFDPSLPLVDVGCGNGRFTRTLAAVFPRALGIDFSPHAIERARAETGQAGNVSYQVLDISAAGAGDAIRGAVGESNLFVRGVLHVLDPARRAVAVANFQRALGGRGTLYFSETNIEGNPLDHLEFQGATATSMPDPLKRCIAAGIRPPSHFGDAERERFFATTGWKTLESGKTVMHGIPLHEPGRIEDIPSYYAIVRPVSS